MLSSSGTYYHVGFAPRDSKATSNLINLSYWFNANLKGNWYGDATDNDLADLPAGIQVMADTSFDVRGLVQLATHVESNFPQRVSGIIVKGTIQRIHFLHGAIRGDNEPPGAAIGKYIMRYADGATEERPIILGQDVLDWYATPPVEEDGGPVVAWSGTSAKSRREGETIHLYKTTWDNPRPDVEVVSLDFASVGQTAAPFLVAITIE